MKRYTKKLGKPLCGLEYAWHDENNEMLAIQKLGILEDYEECIGIPLKAYFRLEFGFNDWEEILYIIKDGVVLPCEFMDEDDGMLRLLYNNETLYKVRYTDYNSSWFFEKKDAENYLNSHECGGEVWS